MSLASSAPTRTRTHRARINLGRRLARLETNLSSLLASTQHRHLAARNLDNLASLLLDLTTTAQSNVHPDPLLDSYQQRLDALQTIISNAGYLDTLPRPQYALKAARSTISNTATLNSHTNVLDQLREHTRVQRDVQLHKRQQLLNLKLDLTSTSPTSSSTSSTLPSPPIPSVLRHRHQGTFQSDTSLSSSNQSTTCSHTTMNTIITNTQDVDQDLDHHQRLHDHLTAGLVDMVQTLKSNAQAFSDGLDSDATLVSQAEQNLTNNISRMTREGKRVLTYGLAARWTTCTLVLVLTVVAFVSIGMFVVIKVF